RLASQLVGGEPSQLVVDERQEFIGGPRIAPLDRRQDPRHVAHRGPPEVAARGRFERLRPRSPGPAAPRLPTPTDQPNRRRKAWQATASPGHGRIGGYPQPG